MVTQSMKQQQTQIERQPLVFYFVQGEPFETLATMLKRILQVEYVEITIGS